MLPFLLCLYYVNGCQQSYFIDGDLKSAFKSAKRFRKECYGRLKDTAQAEVLVIYDSRKCSVGVWMEQLCLAVILACETPSYSLFVATVFIGPPPALPPPALWSKKVVVHAIMNSDDVIHYGSCHCQAVKWSVRAPPTLNCIKCNCSICKKKSNHHCIVSRDRFTLLKGEEYLTTYTFNTHQAKHKFCRVCGVQSFYVPRSNPDSIGVMPHCIDSPTVEKLQFTTFDGEHWEEEMKKRPPQAL